jgi:hypothetical protein
MNPLDAERAGAWLAASHRFAIAMALGCVFLLGGIGAAVSIPAPAWFIALDLLLAYLPMAWLGWRVASRFARPAVPAVVAPGTA